MLDPVQDDEARALTDVNSINDLALKTYEMVAIGVLLQDKRRKNRRSRDLIKASVG